jgi:PH and SEC7 domain-containing protein
VSLISSLTLLGIYPNNTVTRGSAASQQDLHVTDLGLASFPTRSSRVIDDPDVDMRAQELATKCWNEDEEFLSKDKIAEWLGGT